MNETHQLDCPHPDCAGVLRIRSNVPDGEYDCICHSQRVKVTWITQLTGPRYPVVRIVEKKDKTR